MFRTKIERHKVRDRGGNTGEKSKSKSEDEERDKRLMSAHRAGLPLAKKGAVFLYIGCSSRDKILKHHTSSVSSKVYIFILLPSKDIPFPCRLIVSRL